MTNLPTNPGAVVQTGPGEVFVLADRWRQLPNGEAIGPDWLSEQPFTMLSLGADIEPQNWGTVVEDAKGDKWYRIQYESAIGLRTWQSRYSCGDWDRIPKPATILLEGVSDD